MKKPVVTRRLIGGIDTTVEPTKGARYDTSAVRPLLGEVSRVNVRSLLILLAAPLLAATSIHTDFEGGSLGRIEKVSEAHFRLGAKGEKDQEGRNRQANWYYFRVDGAPKTELLLDIVDLPGEYNYQPNRG